MTEPDAPIFSEPAAEPAPEPVRDSAPRRRNRPTTRAGREAAAAEKRAARHAPRPDREPKPAKPRTAKAGGPLGPRIAEFYAATGFGASMFLGQEEGQWIAQNAEAAGHAWEQLAKESPAVAAMWEKLLTGSAWGAVIMVHVQLGQGLIAIRQSRAAAQLDPETAAQQQAAEPEAAQQAA